MLEPDNWENTVRVLSDLRLGLPVVLLDGKRQVLCAAAETISRGRLTELRQLGQGHLAVTSRRAEVLKAMVYDGDLARLLIPDDADVTWIRGMADPSLDLIHPMKGPFSPVRGGETDLERTAITLCKQARLLPTAVIIPLEAASDFPRLIKMDIRDTQTTQKILKEISVARVPLSVAADVRVHVFGNASDFSEHYAIEVGDPDRRKPVLSRLHSACFTGDVLGSLKCDCGAQLKHALDQIAKDGAGVLLYLNQEGRGIGLANKLRAYALQDQGFDTVEANHRLGFEDDERDFQIGAEILQKMGFDQVRLMTNNPAKVQKMNEAGVTVLERVPHLYGKTKENESYLKTKASKSGHLL